MVQQRLKDYKPFKCSKIFHTHLKSQTSKKKGGGGGSFPDGSVLKNQPVSAGDTGSIPDLGRSHRPWGV